MEPGVLSDVTLEDIRAAARRIAGAGAVAAALAGRAGSGRVACVVSGGNIDPAKLVAILAGRMP